MLLSFVSATSSGFLKLGQKYKNIFVGSWFKWKLSYLLSRLTDLYNKKKNVFRPFGLLTLASQDLAVVRTLWWLPIMWVKLPKLPCEVPLPPLCSWWSLLEFCLLMPSIFMTLYIGWQSLAFVLVYLVRKSFYYLIIINFILMQNVAKSF